MTKRLTGQVSIDTIAIFSARYSHQRRTSASFATIQALKSGLWSEMSIDGKRQLLDETKESSWCKDEWEEFKVWARENM